MHRRLLSAAATGALLLGLAACGETTEGPVTTPPPDLGVEAPSDGGGDSPTASDGGGESEEPTAEAPDIPAPDPADFAGMDEHTAEGAEQAFKYYIAVSVWSHQTGDESALVELEADDCGGCEYLNSDIAKSRENSLLWTESAISDVDLTSIEGSKFDYEIRYKYLLGTHSRADSEFKNPIDVPELQYDAVGGMDWDNEQWLVAGMSIEWGEDVH